MKVIQVGGRGWDRNDRQTGRTSRVAALLAPPRREAVPAAEDST